MDHLRKFVLLSMAMAFFIWLIEMILPIEETDSPESLISRIRNSGF